MFPAASKARTVTWFDPTNSGIAADHVVVPLAVPEDPVLVDQVTLATPTLSEAVPENVSVANPVETVLPPGDVMLSVGAVVSVPPDAGVGVGVGVGVGAGVRVGGLWAPVRAPASNPAPGTG